MKYLEYIAITVLLKMIGGMIFLLRKTRGLTEKLMDKYEKQVLGGETNVKRTEKGTSAGTL